MLKTSAVTAFLILLGLPLCAFARTAESSHNVPEGYSERLPLTRTNDSDKDCDGHSVQDFVQGKCHKLNGFDLLRDIKTQLNGSKPGTALEYFQKESGGHGWSIYGDQSPIFESPMRRAPKYYRFDSEFSKQSVDDFMNGKTNRLRGIDAIPTKMKAPLPPAWGGDEFVKTDGFTQSGEPYQKVNPLYGIDLPKLDNLDLKFEKLKQPQK